MLISLNGEFMDWRASAYGVDNDLLDKQIYVKIKWQALKLL